MEACRLTEFHLRNEPTTVCEYYAHVYDSHVAPRGEEFDEVYVCGPINSALRRRVHNDIPTVLAENGAITERLGAGMVETIGELQAALPEEEANQDRPIRITMPHRLKRQELPEQKGYWQELEFNLFWLFYVNGVPVEFAAEFQNLVYREIDRETFSNHFGDWNKRWELYKRIADMFKEFVKSKKIGNQLKKVGAIVTTVDSQHSIGSLYEQYIAHTMDITTAQLLIDDTHASNQGIMEIFAEIAANDLQQGRFANSPLKVPTHPGMPISDGRSARFHFLITHLAQS